MRNLRKARRSAKKRESGGQARAREEGASVPILISRRFIHRLGFGPGRKPDRIMASSARASEGAVASSSSTSEATTPMAHEHVEILPGPFVVLQGVPGDGCANTVDSMPLLSYHGAYDDGEEEEDDDGRSVDDEEEGGQEILPAEGDSSDGDGSGAPAAAPAPIASASEQVAPPMSLSGTEEEDGSGGFHHVETTERGESEERVGEREGSGSAEGGSNGSAVLFFDTSTSEEDDDEGGEATATAGGGRRPRSVSWPRHRHQETDDGDDNDDDRTPPSDVHEEAHRRHRHLNLARAAAASSALTGGGLHLPVPPTATGATLGVYGGILPPLLSQQPPAKRPAAAVEVSIETTEPKSDDASAPAPATAATAATAATIPAEASSGVGASTAAAAIASTTASTTADSFIVVQDATSSAPPAGRASASTTQASAPHRTEAAAGPSQPTAPSEEEEPPPPPPSTRTTSPSPRRPMTRQERRAVRRWNAERREREVRQWLEVQSETDRRPPPSRGRTGADPIAEAEGRMWWQTPGTGYLVLFSSLPKLDRDAGGVMTRPVAGSLAPGSTVLGTAIVSVDARTFEPLPDEASSSEAAGAARASSRRRHHQSLRKKGVLQFLQIESPQNGYVLYSLEGYVLLGPGLPSYYADPQSWTWRVSCPDGAYVREGLELTSTYVMTVPHGEFLRVTRKTVNSMGLARLRVEAARYDDDGSRVEEGSVTAVAAGGGGGSNLRHRWTRRRGQSHRGGRPSPRDGASAGGGDGDGAGSASPPRRDERAIVRGWISEALNPLSGQRGPVAQPLPFPVPALYRVLLPAGAVIRSDVELSSSSIGHAPAGAILRVTGRAFSEHPMDQCIERLRLAGGGGWVSVRLNRPSPLNELVLELIGIDGSFDPNKAGSYHLDATRRVLEEHHRGDDDGGDHDEDAGRGTEPPDPAGDGGGAGGPSGGGDDGDVAQQPGPRRPYRRMSTFGELSSINDDEDEDDEENGRESSTLSGSSSSSSNRRRAASAAAGGSVVGNAVPTLFRSGVTGRGGGVGHPRKSEERCLICLTEERNATIVHGGTGHIACCLACARILKARGDKCPVCRLPIDSVIQQFWA